MQRPIAVHPVTRVCTVLAVLALGAAPAAAKKNDPNIRLEFTPTEEVGAAEPLLSEAMFTHPVAMSVRDARPGDEPAYLGTRTDDDDRRHTLRAVNDVQAFTAHACRDTARKWGVLIEERAELVLEVALERLHVLETNQAVGATYNSEARFSGELRSGGDVLWSGRAMGDATRYGKKFSNENVNEVLSDALVEAFSELLSDPGLHQAWAGRSR